MPRIKGEKAAVNAQQVVKDALSKNPDMRLVLEIAARAREVESKEPPISMDRATETVAVPTNPQGLVPQGTPPAC